MKRIQKTLSLILVFVLLFTLCGCESAAVFSASSAGVAAPSASQNASSSSASAPAESSDGVQTDNQMLKDVFDGAESAILTLSCQSQKAELTKEQVSSLYSDLAGQELAEVEYPYLFSPQYSIETETGVLYFLYDDELHMRDDMPVTIVAANAEGPYYEAGAAVYSALTGYLDPSAASFENSIAYFQLWASQYDVESAAKKLCEQTLLPYEARSFEDAGVQIAEKRLDGVTFLEDTRLEEVAIYNVVAFKYDYSLRPTELGAIGEEGGAMVDGEFMKGFSDVAVCLQISQPEGIRLYLLALCAEGDDLAAVATSALSSSPAFNLIAFG